MKCVDVLDSKHLAYMGMEWNAVELVSSWQSFASDISPWLQRALFELPARSQCSLLNSFPQSVYYYYYLNGGTTNFTFVITLSLCIRLMIVFFENMFINTWIATPHTAHIKTLQGDNTILSK